MEFESPIRNQNGEIIINIHIPKMFRCVYISKDINPVPNNTNDLKLYIDEFSKYLESYSIKWLTSPILPIYFIDKVIHIWTYRSPAEDNNRGSITVRQIWTPKHIHFSRGKYNLTWILNSSEYGDSNNLVPSSGQDDEFNIPYADETIIATILESPRAKIKNKIRKARIKATASRWKLNELIKSYYEKYGTLEGIDKESPLSSDIDSNPESNENT